MKNDDFWNLLNFGEKKSKMAAMVAIYIKLLDISFGPLDRLSPKFGVVENDEFLMLSNVHDPR